MIWWWRDKATIPLGKKIYAVGGKYMHLIPVQKVGILKA